MFTKRMRFAAIAIFSVLILAGCSKSPEERAKAHFERGREFVAKGDDVRARLEFRNAVQFNQNMVDAWRALGDIEDRSKNWPAVYSAAIRVSELDPKDTASRLRLATLNFVSRKFDDALKFATEAVEIDPKNVSALSLRAGILLRLNDNRAAIQEANKVLAIDPGNTEAMVVLAAEKVSRGDLKGALAELNDLSAEGQRSLSAIILKIRIYETLKDLPNIEAQLKRLIEVYPNESGFKQELIKFYIANKRPNDAEQLVRSLAAADPENAGAGLDVARLVGGLKGVGAAREELVAQIAKAKNKTPYQIALSELDFTQGRFDDAKVLLEGIIKQPSVPADANAARVKLAEMYLLQRDFKVATSMADQVLSQDARNVAALRIRATAKIELGELEGAINDARAALNDQPRSAELLTILGLAYERGGQIELADKQLADAMRSSNFDPAVGLNYVTFLTRRGLREHAENVLTELVNRNPNNANVLASMAQMKLNRRDWAAAQDLAERIKKLGQGAGTAAEIQAAALAGQNKFAEGISVLQDVHAANPEATRPMLSIVRSYLQAKQPEKAEQFLNSMLKVSASNPEVYVMLGVTSLAQNKPDEAKQRFEKAISVQPKSPVGYRALADEQARIGKFDEGLKVVDTGLKEIPNDFGLRQVKASLLERKGDVDSAISLYDQMLKEQPGSMVVANNYASLISDHKSDKESLDRAYVAALALNKSDVPQFKDTLGWIYYLRGDYKSALPLLEQASSQLPNLALVRYHLGMTYKALGEPQKALEQLKKAAELETAETTLKGRIKAVLQELSKGNSG